MTDKTPDPCGSDSSTELGALPEPVATIANDGHPRHIGHVWGIGEARLYGPPRNLYREDQLKAYAAAAVAAERERCAKLLDDLIKQCSEINARLALRHAAVALRTEQPNTKGNRPAPEGKTR